MTNEHTDWPRWVVPHANHVHRKNDGDGPAHVSVPLFPVFHVNRVDGTVMVYCEDERDESRALADPSHVEHVEVEVPPVG